MNNEQCFMITGKSGQLATSSYGKLDTCSKFSFVFPSKWVCRALFNPSAKLPTELPAAAAAAAPPPCPWSVVCSSRHAAAVCRSSSGCSATQSFSPFTERTPDVVPERCQLFSPSHRQPLSAFLPPTLEGQFFPSSCLHFFFLSGLISLLFLFFVFFFVPLIPLFFSCWISLLSCKSLPELFTLCFVLLLEGKPVLYPFLSLFSVSFFFVTFCSLFKKKMKSAVFLISYRIYLDFHEFGSSVCPPHRNHTTSFFFNSCKVQNGFLCILYLNAAGAAWQMWGCWCCWWWAGVSWTDQIPPNCSCLWRDCFCPKSDLSSVNTCLQLHTDRDTNRH